MINEIMGSNLRTRETILLGENEIRIYTEIIEASAPTAGAPSTGRSSIASRKS